MGTEMIMGIFFKKDYLSECEKQVLSKEILKYWKLKQSDEEKVTLGLNMRPDFVIKMSINDFNSIVNQASLNPNLIIEKQNPDEGKCAKNERKQPTDDEMLDPNSQFHEVLLRSKASASNSDPSSVSARMISV